MLLPDEYRFGATPGVMLGYRFWKAHFGGDPAAVGRTLQVGGERHTIVGVTPARGRTVPGRRRRRLDRAGVPSVVISQSARLDRTRRDRQVRADATMAAARDEIATIAARLAATYPATNRDRTVRLDGLQDAMVGPIKPMMLLLALSVAMLLAVACANIANLLLAQAHARTLEFGIRGAVGASPGRLARQLWTESLGLFAVAGASARASRNRSPRGSSRDIPTRFRSPPTWRSTAACWRSRPSGHSPPRSSPGSRGHAACGMHMSAPTCAPTREAAQPAGTAG